MSYDIGHKVACDLVTSDEWNLSVWSDMQVSATIFIKDGAFWCRTSDGIIVSRPTGFEAIQYAIDNITVGGKILIHAGTYESAVSGLDASGKQIFIEGVEQESVLLRLNAASGNVIQTDSALCIKSLEIRGSGKSSTTEGIRILGAWGCKIQDVTIRHVYVGVHVSGDSGWNNFEDMYLDNLQIGFYGTGSVTRGETIVCRNIQVVASGAVNPTYGLIIEKADACWFHNFCVEPADVDGIWIKELADSETMFIGCHVMGAERHAIRIETVFAQGIVQIIGGQYKGAQSNIEVDDDGYKLGDPSYDPVTGAIGSAVYFDDQLGSGIYDAFVTGYTTETINQNRNIIRIIDSEACMVQGIRMTGKTGAERAFFTGISIESSDDCIISESSLQSMNVGVVDDVASNDNVVIGVDTRDYTASQPISLGGTNSMGITRDATYKLIGIPFSLAVEYFKCSAWSDLASQSLFICHRPSDGVNDRVILEREIGVGPAYDKLWIDPAGYFDQVHVGSIVNTSEHYRVDDVQVVTNRQVDPTNVAVAGVAQDGTCRTKVNEILAIMRTHGLIG